MIIESLFFYVFSALLLGSAAAVIFARNPVHAVLFLILAFFNAAGLFVMLGAEFIAMLLVIVYVGAVAVLFLFIVMMLDINFAELRRGMHKHLPVSAFVGIVLFLELVWVYAAWKPESAVASRAFAPAPAPDAVTNTHALGQVLYTHYMYPFQLAGLILLVAMIGAIVLTLRPKRNDGKRQDVAAQVARNPQDVIRIVRVETGKGVE